jgi:glycosyltransferase involved in cell wall biosynthesis
MKEHQGFEPRISVVMPAYNSAAHLAEAIESVLNQTLGDFELLVVVDNSSDGTEDIVRQYEVHDPRVRLLVNKHTPGIVGALNTGLEAARGKYFARADADDINRPYRFEKQVEYLENHPDIYVLGGGFVPFDENGSRGAIHHPSSSISIAWHSVCTARFGHPTVMFRREVFVELGGYPDVESEDFAYFSDVVKRYRGANMPLVLIDYRQTLTNRSKVMAQEGKDSVRLKSLENIRYYLGESTEAEKFYLYQNRHVLKLSDLLRIMSVNRKLLSRMTRDYGVRPFSRDVMRLRGVIILGYIRKLCKTYLKKDLKDIKDKLWG